MSEEHLDRARMGVAGLDEILRGGLPRGRTCLLQGSAGTGKTTLALQFLREGLREGERCLYLTLLQSEAELGDVARSHGWDLDGIEVAHVPEQTWIESDGQTLFSTYDVELAEISDVISGFVEKHRPQRLVIDSVGELGMLVENYYQLRRALLRLKLDLARHDCTAIVTAGDATAELATALDTIFNGVIRLTRDQVLYGRSRRRLEIVKQRGMAYSEGLHDFRICTGGLEVYPRLEYDLEQASDQGRVIASGLEELDKLVGGGLNVGTACLLAGSTGAGKTTIASLFVSAAADDGLRGAIYCFDEGIETYLNRSDGLGLGLRDHRDAERVELRTVAVGEVSSGEFVDEVRRAVEDDGVKIVAIDSLTGFLHAMDDEHEVILQLHELLAFLGARGVLTLMIITEHGLPSTSTDIDASYLADTVLLLRHFESRGTMHRCIAVTKKRHGPHEHTLRQLRLSPGQVQVGPALSEFDGILSGTPVFHGSADKVIEEGDHDDTGR